MYSIYDQINNRKVLVYPERTTVDVKTTGTVELTNEQIASTNFPEDIDVKPEIYFDKVEIGDGNFIYNGDNIKVLKTLPENSVDSVVTDPPYGLKFMGKQWDYDVPSVELWKECYRVLKPGGYLLSFGSSRTYHRMVVKVEDAGFEIRDQIMWVYGSGFPKSHNVGKAVDKILGNEREVVGEMKAGNTALGQNSGWNQHENKTEIDITKGTSEWEGFGTNLKPAHEPIVLARKPFKGSVAKNVLKWNTGGINIDDCRVGEELITTNGYGINGFLARENYKPSSHIGRFPANIILDKEAGEILDEQSGECGNGWKKNYGEKDYKGKQYNSSTNQCIHGGGYTGINTYSDKGGASRFFYCPKPSKKEKEIGLKSFQVKSSGIGSTYASNQNSSNIRGNPERKTNPKKNFHPTVKPKALIQYLIRLVTPINGCTIDPFFGSGTSGISAQMEGNYKFIGIEKEKEYFNIAVERCQYEQSQLLKVAA